MACCTFHVLEVRSITANRFKNQSGGTLKILVHDCNHQQGLVKQENVAVYHCGFKVEFPNFYWDRYLFWVKFIDVAIVTQNWNNIGSNAYVSTAALLPNTLITKKSGLSISVHFHKNFLIVTCCTFCRFEIRTLTPKVDSKIRLIIMTHWHYLATIAIINKDFLNKKLLLSIIAVLN